MTEVEPDQIVSIMEVAQIVGLPTSTIRTYRRRGLLPEPLVVLGSGPIWRRADIEHWNTFERRRRTTTGGGA